MSREIYRLLVWPTGIVQPTFSPEEYDRLSREAYRSSVMLITAQIVCLGLGFPFLAYALFCGVTR